MNTFGGVATILDLDTRWSYQLHALAALTPGVIAPCTH
jgi:hypothetical protein